MKLRILKTTDKRHIGTIVDSPANGLGQLTLQGIQDLAEQYFGGQFQPTTVEYQLPNKVRLISSNYSATLEAIDG